MSLPSSRDRALASHSRIFLCPWIRDLSFPLLGRLAQESPLYCELSLDYCRKRVEQSSVISKTQVWCSKTTLYSHGSPFLKTPLSVCIWKAWQKQSERKSQWKKSARLA